MCSDRGSRDAGIEGVNKLEPTIAMDSRELVRISESCTEHLLSNKHKHKHAALLAIDSLQGMLDRESIMCDCSALTAILC